MPVDQPPVQPFLPVTAVPAIHMLAQPDHGGIPVAVVSHGYHYLVTGNTLLSSQGIRKLLDRAASPMEAVGALSAAYRQEGYFLVAVKAAVNGQSIHVMVVQGQITEKNVAPGLGWFYTGLRGEHLDEADVIRRNILASAYSTRNGYQLAPSFAPAQNPGGSTLNVEQKPLPGYHMVGGNLMFGNYGSRYTSSYIGGASAYIRPGAGLEIDGSYSHGFPSLSKASAGSIFYQGSIGISSITPWGTYGFTSQWTHYMLGQVTAPYYFTGNVETDMLTGSQLLYASTTTRFAVNEGYAWSHYRETVLQGLYTLSKQNYQYYTVGATYNRIVHLFGENASTTLGFNYNQGVSGYHGTFVKGPGAPSPQFRYLTFNTNYTQSLPWGMSAQFTGNGQWAFNTLPQNQEWVVGGFGSVSAYDAGILVGDSGYSARLSLQTPAVHHYGVTATGSLFYETAGVTSNYLSPHQAPWQNLSDVGVGLNMSTRWGTSVSVMSALPVSHSLYPASSAANLSKERVDAYFILQQSF